MNSIRIRMLVGVRNDGNGETMVTRIETGQAYAINGNGSFFNGYVVRFRIVFKIKKPTSVVIFPGSANCRLIYMALNNVTIKSAVSNKATLEIDLVPHLPVS